MTVNVTEPYNETECQNVSEVSEVCTARELNFTVGNIGKHDVCTNQDLCAASDANGVCRIYYCSKAITRCLMNVTNLDQTDTGDWTAAANFTLAGAVFAQNPVIKRIRPGETVTYDFQLMYDMDLNQNRPTCVVTVTPPPPVDSCVYITTPLETCHNVTEYRTSEQEVCD